MSSPPRPVAACRAEPAAGPSRQTTSPTSVAVGRRDDAVRTAAAALAAFRRQAQRIPDAGIREGFLSRVPENIALQALARELGVVE